MGDGGVFTRVARRLGVAHGMSRACRVQGLRTG